MALIVNAVLGLIGAALVAGLIHDVPTVKELIDRIVSEAEVIINQRLAKIQAA